MSVLTENLHVEGHISCRTMAIPSGTVDNDDIAGSAGIAYTKAQQKETHHVTQAHGTAATTERRVIHTVKGATATIVGFRCGVVVACVGAATISIRLKKNGTNVDTAALVIDNTNAAFAFESAAGFTSTALVANDVLEVDITAAAGGGTLGQGLFCELITSEDPQ